MTNGVDKTKMLDIQVWVNLVYVSSVYKSICDTSDSNTPHEVGSQREIHERNQQTILFLLWKST